MTSFDVLKGIVEKVNLNDSIKNDAKELAGKIFQFKPSDAPEYYMAFLSDGSVQILQGTSPNADATIIGGDQVLSDVIAGKEDPMKAFFAGKLRVSGNLFLSQRLINVMKKALQ